MTVRQRALKTACVSAVLGALLAAPAALADANITAAPPNQFLNPDVTIDQGGKVTFTNNDTVGHDVTARDNGPDGKPLFASPLTSSGQTTTVKGTEYLTTGDYAFICSIHPNMTGTLHVTSAGTPVPRPSSGGSGSGSGSSSSSGSNGTAKLSVKFKLVDTRVSAVRRHGALRVKLTLNEAATVRLTAKAGRTTLATRTVKAAKAGTRSVSLKLTKAGRRAVRGKSRLAVSLAAHASDGAGNAATATGSRTLRR